MREGEREEGRKEGREREGMETRTIKMCKGRTNPPPVVKSLQPPSLLPSFPPYLEGEGGNHSPGLHQLGRPRRVEQLGGREGGREVGGKEGGLGGSTGGRREGGREGGREEGLSVKKGVYEEG